MRKWITGIFILVSINSSFSKSLREKVQGDWLCISVIDSAGHTIASEFGDSDGYLRFTFQGKFLFVAQAPFDRGINFPVHYGQDFIDPFFERNWDMPELFYRVSSIDSSKLVLQATSEKKQYVFVNQKQYVSTTGIPSRNKNVLIFISQQWMQSALYKINNIDQENLYPCPRFKDDRFSTLGNYLAFNFHFPKALLSDTLSLECVAEFDVFKKGIINLKIVKGSNYAFNTAIFDVMWMTRKNWTPIKVGSGFTTTHMRFKFVFSNLPIPYKLIH